MKKKVLRLVVSGESINELKSNMQQALAELNGEETTAAPRSQVTAPAPRPEVEPVRETPPILIPIPQMSVQAPVAPTKTEVMRTGTPSAEIDSMGLPWDERIHSVSAAKNKDGSWRTRRGVEPAFVKQVEHELIAKIKNGGAAEVPTFSPPVIQQTFVPPAPPPVMQTLQPSPPVAPSAPLGNLTAPAPAALPPMVPQMAAPFIATPVAPAPPPPFQVTSAHTLATFTEQFVPTLSHLVAEGKLTNEYVAALKNYFKLEQIYDANPTQIGEMFETFCKAGLLTKVG